MQTHFYLLPFTLTGLLLLSACSQKPVDTPLNQSHTEVIAHGQKKEAKKPAAGRTPPDNAATSSEPIAETRSQVADTLVEAQPAPLPERRPDVIAPGFPPHHATQKTWKQRKQLHHGHPLRRAPNTVADRERYQHFDDNSLKLAHSEPVSTFSVDVDSGSYANIRRMLKEGRLPRRDAVRIEELINYFDYDYPLPDSRKQPFSVTTEIAPTPWNHNSHLLHIGLKAFAQKQTQLPPANLVFLIDVSGSMRAQNKLGLLKKSLRMLVKRMRTQDRISIVVYAGASGMVLEPTGGDQKQTILNALEGLQAGGSTNGSAGIQLAYETARNAYIDGGINRILLCTDGDFNVGTTSFNALMEMVEQQRKDGIALSTIGFGRGNLNDHLAEQLANRGNGQYSYIDSLQEAQKVLVQQMSGSLLTVAKDVKVQIEFNPATVYSYRLIGYVNRKLAREDFNNDQVDAGDIGAGHTVTALYEVTLVEQADKPVDPLRYGQSQPDRDDRLENELAFVKLRYKLPDASQSRLLSTPLTRDDILTDSQNSSDRFQFSASVAAFGQKLRGGKYLHGFNWQGILELARQGRGNDMNGHRGEFIQLINLARTLDTQAPLETFSQR